MRRGRRRTVALALVLLALGVGAALLVQEVPAAVLHKALRVLRMPALSWRTDGATTLNLGSCHCMLLHGIRDNDQRVHQCALRSNAPAAPGLLTDRDGNGNAADVPCQGQMYGALSLWMEACTADHVFSKTAVPQRARLNDALQDGLPV